MAQKFEDVHRFRANTAEVSFPIRSQADGIAAQKQEMDDLLAETDESQAALTRRVGTTSLWEHTGVVDAPAFDWHAVRGVDEQDFPGYDHQMGRWL